MNDQNQATGADNSAAFRGARRVENYSEPTQPAPPAEGPSNASEHLLAQFGSGTSQPVAPAESAPPALAAPTAEHRQEAAAEAAEVVAPAAAREPVLTFEPHLRSREHSGDVPSRGIRRALRKMGIRIGPSAQEQHAHRMSNARTLIRLLTRPGGVLVAQPKGGDGKTPLSLSIGGVIAQIRGGGTIVLEVSDDPGALSVRAEGAGSVGIAELLRDIDQITTSGQLGGYIAQQSSYAAVIGTPGDRRALTGDDVRRIAALTDTYYPIRVMDSGNQPTSSAFHGAVDVADVLVIPVLDAMPGWQGAMQLLRHLHQVGGHAADLARNAIIVRMHDGRPEDRDVIAYGDQLIENAGIQHVFHVPFDPHIADRTTLTFSRLAPATIDAITLLTAAIVQQLNQNVRKA